jgi:RNA polymerase sigma factor (sigma-70 family)
MATNQLGRMIQTLRVGTLLDKEASLSDGQLLECYVQSQSETAFTALVHRHGPMVLGVCHRVLRSPEDAEDAFQATFLVLFRKAASIVSKELVASWLYSVAHQTASKARAIAARRRAKERELTVRPEPTLEPQDHQGDLRALLDQELGRLPEKYRAVIVLCDLEGKTRKEAARHFNLPEGTVASRLATAREMLAKRLARHGLTVSASLLAALISQRAEARVPTALLSSTIQAATSMATEPAVVTGVVSGQVAALTEGVLQAMCRSRLQTVMALFLVLVLAVSGVGVLQVNASRAQGEVDQPAAGAVERGGNTRELATPEDNKPAAKRDEKPAAAPGVGDAIAWGKAEYGLQAGLGFRPGDKHSCRIGDSVTLVVYLRNVSDGAVSLSHIETVFEEWLPRVEDADAKEHRILPGPMNLGQVSQVKRTLEKGETIRLGTAWFRVERHDWRGAVPAPTLRTRPGKYLIHLKNFPFRRAQKDTDDNSGPTGQVELEVKGE